MKKIGLYFKEHWIKWLIAILPIMDIATYFFMGASIDFVFTFARFLLLPILYIYAFILSKNRKYHYIFTFILLIYSLCHILSCYLSGYINFVEDVANLLRILYMPILLFSFLVIFKSNKNMEKEITDGILIAFIITIVSIVLSLITDTANYTYADDISRGIIGWFYSKNSQTLILITLSLICGIYSLKKKSFYIILPVICLALYFNATKAAFISLIVLLAMCVFYTIFEIKNAKKILYSILMLILVVGTFKLSPTYRQLTSYIDHQTEGNADIQEEFDPSLEEEEEEDDDDDDDLTNPDASHKPNSLSRYETLYRKYALGILIDNYGIENVVEKYNYTTDAFILANTRTKKKIAASLIYDSESNFSHAVGFEFTKINNITDSKGNIETLDLENDITALFYYLGYVGLALYLGFILYFVIKIFKILIKNPKYILKAEYMIWVVLIFLLVVGGEYNGALLRRPSANIYLAIVISVAVIKFENILRQKNPKKKLLKSKKQSGEI